MGKLSDVTSENSAKGSPEEEVADKLSSMDLKPESQDPKPLDSKDSPPKFNFGEKKKKRTVDAESPKAEIIDGTGQVFVKGHVYPYEELLARIQSMINANNPDLSGSKRYTIKPPQVVRVGSKKVAWINFRDICSIMGRSMDHVHQFVLAELGTEGSIAGDGQLVLKGKYGPKNIESLLRKYITEYVTCSMCKSPNTTMERDCRARLFTQHCEACGANRSVNPIKNGFHALNRGERRKAKV
ncbi:eukaryotic translation initiation factor 2, beta, putative [Theileria annulata]|uniref:Eukaryotic translation initiation factor 2, beta, putative n=1 Tax=Theileria annulata TaxID=5874 RepID=Q4UF34_THEAN|nr:eukaryotic translation initiation factor 2, beta, putative [Theileria annulata]CAI74305.1 eukaryotic translation initiation factor 2, beta, putative [Theileria annulata]|eukprot:XP_952037.1 eukaryotic translation initiation factor 2, beta, putative [Theileria annulata]